MKNIFKFSFQLPVSEQSKSENSRFYGAPTISEDALVATHIEESKDLDLNIFDEPQEKTFEAFFSFENNQIHQVQSLVTSFPNGKIFPA